MKLSPYAVALALVLAYVSWTAYRELAGMDEIVYRGHHFKLAKKYATYEDYKDDPDNLRKSELPRIRQVMLEAHLPQELSSRNELFHQVLELAFPGYGWGSGPKVEPDSSQLDVLSIEIPGANEDRYFVGVRLSTGKVRVVDDFLVTPASRLSARSEGQSIVFRNDAGKIVHTTRW